MPDLHDYLMPDENHADHQGDTLSVSVAKQIEDNIQDAQTLRECRFIAVKIFAVVAGIFYLVLLCVIAMLVGGDEGIMKSAVNAPNVCITALIILAVIPVLLSVQIARAVFGKRQHGDTPYTPLQALVHLIKEMKN